MSDYRITAPVAEYSGNTGGCQFANGVYQGPVAPGPLAYMRAAGYTVEEIEPEPPHDPQATEDAPALTLPAKAAPKAEWVEVAVRAALAESPDVDETEARTKADAMTKDQLVELLTPKEGA
ncbi:hypothetical protein [Actinokineospora sp.]|uniref:hypothetical protein n=1 Tax=Actinokineospora sp. TaxID=1872133 RepID=UPI003D6B949E